MLGKFCSLALLVAISLFVSCAQPEVEKAAEAVSDAVAAAAERPDPTVVDPDHYVAEFENDRVRIVRIKYGPGEESPMHYHPDHVGVFLTDLLAEVTMADGSTEELSFKAGEHGFAPAEQHRGKNLGGDFEIVMIDLKSGPTGAAIEPDSVAVDPAHYTAEFENDQVRIVRIAYGAGEESTMHFHPDSVAVFLTDHLVQMTLPDGSKQEISAQAGESMFIPAGQHLPKNISDKAWELVLVELK